MIETTQETRGSLLKEYRENLGFSQEELAKKIGVTALTIHRWEKGHSPSKLATEKLISMGIPEEVIPKKIKSKQEALFEELPTQTARSFQFCGTQHHVTPSPYVLNGPDDQNDFHDLLMSMQEHKCVPDWLTWDIYKQRLSLIEYTDEDKNDKTSQFKLESPRKIAKSWSSNYGSHGWHRYVGRFPPHLVRTLLNHFQAGPKDIILDPFSGSGTTLVEARLLGIPAIGIEICPLSALITRTKSQFPTSTLELVQAARELEIFYRSKWAHFLGTKKIDEFSYLDILSRHGNQIEAFPNYERWLTKEAFLGVSLVIEFASKTTGYTQDAIHLALSAKMRSIGNVDVDVVRAEYSKTPRTNVDVLKLVKNQLSKMVKAINESLESHSDTIADADKITIIEGDVLQTELPEQSISHVITSPPYGVEAISYLRTHLLSYRTLSHYLKTDPYEFGEHVIGSEFLPKVEPDVSDFKVSSISQTYNNFFSSFLKEQTSKKHQLRSLMMMKFFEDMNEVAVRLSKWIKPGGNLAFVIGNKKIDEQIVPTDEIMKEIFLEHNFDYVNSIGHKLKTNNSNSQVPWQDRIIQDEFVMLFRRRTH